MRVNSVDNKTNFGWDIHTHTKITSKVLRDMPNLVLAKSDIMIGVIKAARGEKGVLNNKHYYFKPEFMKPRESYLDFLGNNNAYSAYRYHLNEAKADDSDLYSIADKARIEIGKALLFLQEVTQPHNVERTSAFDKILSRSVQDDFEAFATKNADEFIHEAKPFEFKVPNSDFDGLFVNTVEATKYLDTPTLLNKNEWQDIAKQGIENAMSVTKAFLEEVANKF